MRVMSWRGGSDVSEYPMLFSGAMICAILDGPKRQTRRPIDARSSEFPKSQWDRLEWDDAKIPDELGPNFRDSLRPLGVPMDYLRVAFRPHPDDPSDDAGFWAKQRVVCRHLPGDRLWVRENVQAVELDTGQDVLRYPADGAVCEIPNTREGADAWLKLHTYGKRRGAVVPSIHMPRWASRISLEVTDVKAERVQEMSEADAMAEGVARLEQSESSLGGLPVHPMTSSYIDAFRALWDSIYGKSAGLTWDDNPWVWAETFKVIAVVGREGVAA